MIIEVPLFIQTNQFNCGPTCLKMVIAYFGEHFGVEVLEKRMGVSKDKGANSVQIVAAAANLGYPVVFYSKSLGFNPENNNLEFYKKYNDFDSSKVEVWSENAKKNGAKLIEKKLDLNTLLSYVTEDSIPIALVDWNIIMGRPEGNYQGHFVPVVGYDHKFVYIHNGGYNDHKANIPVEREVFDKARKAPGTDEDFIIIFRKGIEAKVVSDNTDKDKKDDTLKIKAEEKNNDISKEVKKELAQDKKELDSMQKDVLEMKKKIDLLKEKIKSKT